MGHHQASHLGLGNKAPKGTRAKEKASRRATGLRTFSPRSWQTKGALGLMSTTEDFVLISTSTSVKPLQTAPNALVGGTSA